MIAGVFASPILVSCASSGGDAGQIPGPPTGPPAAAVSIAVSPPSASIVVGQTQTFTATVGNTTNTAVTWTSSNTGTATVSAAGVVTGVAAGTATITATSVADPTKQATAAITVTAPVPITLAITPTTILFASGATQQLTPTITGTSNTTVQYVSSASSVATVSPTGVVTGVAPGNAVIAARLAADTTKGVEVPVAVTAASSSATLLVSGVPVTGITSATDQLRVYRIIVPHGASSLDITTTGNNGDLDLYVSRVPNPTASSQLVCGSEGPTSIERCQVANPSAGDWYILLNAFEAFSGVALTATVTAGSTTTGGFSVAVSPSTLAVAVGGTSTLTITAARTGAFSGPIDLVLEGLPVGVTATTTTIPSGTTAATITVTASGSATPTSSSATLRARGSGSPDRTTTIPVSVTATGGGTGSMSISVSNSSLTLTTGGSASVGVTVTRLGGFAGAVSLEVLNLPTGVTMSAAPIASGATTASLTFAAATNAPPGTGTVTVRATGTGVSAATATMSISVVTSGIGITLSSTAVTLLPGYSQRVIATVTGATNTGTFWSAAGSGVAATTSDGWITGIAPGTTTILVRATADSRVSAIISVTVVAGTPQGPWVRISIGSSQMCALNESGRAYCWGSRVSGATGENISDASSVMRPAPAAGALRFRDIAVGTNVVCGVTAAGETWCWGTNAAGALGNGTATTDGSGSITPVRVSAAPAFVSISAASQSVCGTTAAGAAWCWGDNDRGQLGAGITVNSPFRLPSPTLVAGGQVYDTYTVGATHTCGLTRTGAVYCAGNNGLRELGREAPPLTSVTPLLAGGGPYSRLSTGPSSHRCALAADGVPWCWGNNGSGQLGRTTTTDRIGTPAPAQTALRFTRVVSGAFHTCGITADGTAYCWGNNSSGELGDGSFTNRTSPVAVTGGHRFTELAAGSHNTCGITTSGALYCWGSNRSNMLGAGVQSLDRNVPVQVLDPY